MADFKPGDEQRGPGQAMQQAAPYLNAVWELLGGCIVGVGGGYFVDKHFHTSPWGVLVLSMVGISVGFYGFIRQVQRLGKRKP